MHEARQEAQLKNKGERQRAKKDQEKERRANNFEMGVNWLPRETGKLKNSAGITKKNRTRPMGKLMSDITKMRLFDSGVENDENTASELIRRRRAGDVESIVMGDVWVGGWGSTSSFEKTGKREDDDDDDLIL